MPDVHHTYGPSTLNYREVCPGWTNDKSTDPKWADEGTLMHHAAETGDISKLNEEQSSCVTACLNFVRPIEAGATKVLKEQKLDVLNGQTFGTSDRVIWNGVTKKVTVVDFKFGRIPVEDAETNLQGWAYLLGAWALFPEAVEGEVIFLQPRLDVVDRATFNREHDMARMAIRVQTVIERAKRYEIAPDPCMLNPTAKNCLYCGRLRDLSCDRAVSFALATAKKYEPLEVVEEVHSSQITQPSKMAQLLDQTRILEKMVESVKTHAMDLAMHNGGVLCDDNGKVLFEVAEREGSRKVKDLGLALPVLSKHLDDREILQVADVSLPGALKLIGAKAKRGTKAKVIGEVERELAEADAVSRGEPVRYLKKVRT
jgi:hypothetical protein